MVVAAGEDDHQVVRRKQGERGAAAVELAVVLPVLVLMLWGIVEFGRGYSAKVELTAAVRDGARAAAVQTPTDETLVKTATQGAAPGLAGLTVDNVTVVTACPSNYSAGSTAKVKVSYPFQYDILFFGKGTWTITATGVMRCGG
jgi:Flp pilus assembly protein TadG